MFEHVPITVLTAESRSVQFKSASLILAISSICSIFNAPTKVFFGFAEPFVNFAACLIKTDAGGVFNFKLKDLSSNTEISTGITVPILSEVFALYSLQNAIIFTPLAPKAGPTGGAGLALPASSASLIIPTTLVA